MNSTTKQIFYWAPRILAILFSIFISLFALDVFDEGYNLWEALVGLLLHLIPTYLVVISLLIAWRWELLGAIVFIALATLYVLWGKGRQDLIAYYIVSGPLFLIGILFLFNWKFKKQLR